MTAFEGLWISPDRDERIPVVEHLIAIQQDPHRFGLTARDVRGVGIEGLCELAEELIKDGWIRYRYLAGTHLFEILRLDKDALYDVLIDAQAAEHERVVIETLSPRREYSGSVQQFFGGEMFRAWENNPKRAWRLSR